jgi:hypothetical protein
MIDSGAMPAKKKASHSEQEASYAVGDRLKVNLHTGRIVEATVKAVIEHTDGKRLRWILGRTRLHSFISGRWSRESAEAIAKFLARDKRRITRVTRETVLIPLRTFS